MTKSFAGHSDGFVLKLMGVFVCSLSCVSILGEVMLKHQVDDPWVGHLTLFLYLGGDNISSEDISTTPYGIIFIGAAISLLVSSIILGKICGYKQQR